MKIAYIKKKFPIEKLATIAQANTIIVEYQKQGFDLTLRQLYYQFVARGLIPNVPKEYTQLGKLISDARLAGHIDWDAIVDRTRNMVKNSHWENPGEIVEACSRQYQIDKWLGQEFRPEVWIEKDALVGVIERVCRTNDVSFFSCRGYTSQSEMHSAAMRLKGYEKQGQTPVIIYLGDHDPSGIDMSRDIFDRMELFMGGLEVRRIALNLDQVEKYSPPPNPAKVSDPRAGSYIQKFGDESWELDALEPKLFEKLIEKEMSKLRDKKAWAERVSIESQHKRKLVSAAGDLNEDES